MNQTRLKLHEISLNRNVMAEAFSSESAFKGRDAITHFNNIIISFSDTTISCNVLWIDVILWLHYYTRDEEGVFKGSGSWVGVLALIPFDRSVCGIIALPMRERHPIILSLTSLLFSFSICICYTNDVSSFDVL